MTREEASAGATTGAAGGVVALKRARRAADLWTSIETAEFAYVILCEGQLGGRDGKRIDGFRATFGAVAEQWNGGGSENKAPILARLQTAMDRLGGGGIQVYWACVTCSLTRPDGDRLSLPLALLHLDAADADEVEITLNEPMVAEIPGGDDEESDDG